MQNGIILLADVEAILDERSVENNVYLLDNTKKLGSIGEGTSDLTTNIVGAVNPDGSLAAEAVMNWIAYGIAAAPLPVLRAAGGRDPGASRLSNLLSEIKSAKPADVTKAIARSESIANQPSGAIFERKSGHQIHVPLVFPRPLGASQNGSAIRAGDLSPLISNIAGPAVGDGVLYPAQYGSPDYLTEGWYWSATVDTHKIGIHTYEIHLVVHRPIEKNGAAVWKPETYVVESKINVITGIMANGFTGYGPGVLPLVPEPTAA
jgi:hypothetical protein